MIFPMLNRLLYMNLTYKSKIIHLKLTNIGKSDTNGKGDEYN